MLKPPEIDLEHLRQLAATGFDTFTLSRDELQTVIDETVLNRRILSGLKSIVERITKLVGEKNHV
jgi:hypothetical protein